MDFQGFSFIMSRLTDECSGGIENQSLQRCRNVVKGCIPDGCKIEVCCAFTQFFDLAYARRQKTAVSAPSEIQSERRQAGRKLSTALFRSSKC